MNELDMIKLNIFEAYDNGEISYGEKEYLLEQVDYMYEYGASTAERYKKNLGKGISDTAYGAGLGIGTGAGAGASVAAAQLGYNGVMKGADAVGKFANNHPKAAAGLVLGGAALAGYGLYKNHKYKQSIPGMVNKIKNLERELSQTIDPNEIALIKKEIAFYKKQIKQLEKQTVKESTFDTLLESINDLYYDEY